MSDKPFFTANDFPKEYMADMIAVQINAASIANAKLEKALGPVMYFKMENDKACYGSEINTEYDTHQAYLFNIQPIVKKCELHAPDILRINDGYGFSTKCKRCGVPLVATWSAK